MDNVSPDIITEISNQWQFAALLVACITTVFIFYLKKVKTDSEKLVKKESQLIETETQNRKLQRDNQVREIKQEIRDTKTIAEGVGKSFDKHLAEHMKKDVEFATQINKIDQRLSNLETNVIRRDEFNNLSDKVNHIDKNIVKIFTILEERLPK